MYRFFLSPFEEVVDQFKKNYGQENVQIVKTLKEFEQVIHDKDVLNTYHSLVLFSTILLDLSDKGNTFNCECERLREYENEWKNFAKLISIEHRYKYIAIVCQNSEINFIKSHLKYMRKIYKKVYKNMNREKARSISSNRSRHYIYKE